MKITWKKPAAPGDPVVATMKGRIDENALEAFSVAAQELPAGPVDLDMDQITYVNSIGCSHWVTFLRNVTKNRTVRLIRCREPVIDYANLLPQFTCDVRVESLYFPCNCGDCGKSQSFLASSADLQRDADALIATFKCQHCSARVEPAVPAADFVEFLFSA